MRISPGAAPVLAVLLTSCRASDDGLKAIEGRVYARLDDVRGPVGPVAGATVSNNWDQTTATTDQSGRFVIRVKRVAADEFMILASIWEARWRVAASPGPQRVAFWRSSSTEAHSEVKSANRADIRELTSRCAARNRHPSPPP